MTISPSATTTGKSDTGAKASAGPRAAGSTVRQR